jgi:hypothetical protein
MKPEAWPGSIRTDKVQPKLRPHRILVLHRSRTQAKGGKGLHVFIILDGNGRWATPAWPAEGCWSSRWRKRLDLHFASVREIRRNWPEFWIFSAGIAGQVASAD